MSVNVLLNYYNFDGEWTNGLLTQYVVGKKVLILPLAFRESQAWDEQSFQQIYGVNGEKYQNIIRPFLAYGIAEKDIVWLDYFNKTTDPVSQINNADLLFFTGGMPEKAIMRMQELGIVDAVKNFKGVVMGASAGAMLQLAKYHVTPDEDYPCYSLWQGLGLVEGLNLEVHFLNTDLQNQCTKRAIADLHLPVYQMYHEGGLLVVDGKVQTMGNVVLVK